MERHNEEELCVLEGIEIKTEVELDPLELGECTQDEEGNIVSKYVERQIKEELLPNWGSVELLKQNQESKEPKIIRKSTSKSIKDVKKFHCIECNLSFKWRDDLLGHIRRHTYNYPCDQCSSVFKYIGRLLEHQKYHHSKRLPFQCDECHKDFAQKYTLNKHKRTHIDPSNPYTCDQCNEKFAKISSLLRHKRVHFNEKTSTKYPEKPERYNDKELCVLHPIEIKTDIELHPLEHVEYTQDEEGNIVSKYVERHIKEEIEVESLPNWGSVELLKENQKSKEPKMKRKSTSKSIKNVKKFHCIQCDLSFRWKDDLLGHERRHARPYHPYQCDQCSAVFTYKMTLLRHKSSYHFKRLPFECDECDKNFTTNPNLMIHKQCHTKEVQCDECNKKFKTMQNLTKHKECHTKEDPVQCDECDKVFEKKSLLIAHKVIHINGKPYLCDQCSESFSWAYELVVHKSFHAEPIEL